MRTRWLTSLNIIKPSWICLTINPAALTAAINDDLRELELEPLANTPHCYVSRSAEKWNLAWRNISACLARYQLAPNTKVSIVASESRPSMADINPQSRSVEDINELSEQMWLIETIEQNRLICHFQPVIDRRGNVFGYESLVRARNEDGSLVSGGAIFYASKILRIEHLIDRHLHELAIKCYVEQGLEGFLFINLVPGFIQRPEFYFGGLGEAARQYGMNAKKIALDCTNSENPRDIQHLKAITEYCRSKGYLLSLDDIESPHTARRILKELHPDFMKIDMRLVQRAEQPEAMETIRELVDMTQSSSCTVIAEGVETETIRQLLEDADIGLYQGYLFSPPESTSPKAKITSKKAAGAAHK